MSPGFDTYQAVAGDTACHAPVRTGTADWSSASCLQGKGTEQRPTHLRIVALHCLALCILVCRRCSTAGKAGRC